MYVPCVRSRAFLSHDPPVLLHPDRVVKNDDAKQHERHFQPNVALAPHKAPPTSEPPPPPPPPAATATATAKVRTVRPPVASRRRYPDSAGCRTDLIYFAVMRFRILISRSKSSESV